MLVLTHEEIERRRDRIYHRNRLLQVTSIEASLDFINEVGFCFAFAAKNSELPCLWHAACGQRNPVMPKHTHHDPHVSLVWQAKDVLPAQKKVYYGKVLKKRPTFISLDYFPAFYRLIAGDRGPDSYLAEFIDGTLSLPARNILNALSALSPQITRDLKMASGMAHPKQRYEFDQAMAELQTKMFIVKIGEFYDPFTFLWDLVPNRFSEEVAQSQSLNETQAYMSILEKYFQNVLVSNEIQIQRMFGWPKGLILRKLEELLDKKFIIGDVKIENEKGVWYAHKSVLT